MKTSRQDCVLIFRLGSIGDTVVALPCFHAIARTYADSRRILLTNELTSMRTSSAESILDGTGLVDEVLYYPVGDFGIRQALTQIRALKRLRPSALIYLAERPTARPVYRDLAFFTAAGIRKIIGLPWNERLRKCRVDPLTHELEYEAERLARVLERDVPVSLSPANWDLRISASELATADAALDCAGSRTLIAISPGAKIAAKDWGADNWASLVRSLVSSFADVGLVMIGGRDERALCEAVAQPWKGQVLNLCGSLTPRETAATLRRCKLLVCHDSGPMHLAASQQTPCIALFGNYNRPHKWYPFGSGHRVIYEPRGVREISVQSVVREVKAAFHIEDSARMMAKAAV